MYRICKYNFDTYVHALTHYKCNHVYSSNKQYNNINSITTTYYVYTSILHTCIL